MIEEERQMPVKRPKKGSSATLLKSPQESPEPGINELESQSAPECNRIPVLLHSPKERRRGICGASAHRTQAEIERVLGLMYKPRDCASISIVYYRGLRASEIGILEMRDYTPPTIQHVGTRRMCQ
jgi:hypothetical protein